jgi:hypothetical protein
MTTTPVADAVVQRGAHAALLVAVGMALSACQSGSRPDTASPSGKSAALLTMEQVAIAAHRCWFASKDPVFRAYRMANELNSFSGRPRFLLVPAKNYEAKPLLVVQAEGASRHVDVFGPLMGEALGTRISSDVSRWASGDSACGGSG